MTDGSEMMLTTNSFVSFMWRAESFSLEPEAEKDTMIYGHQKQGDHKTCGEGQQTNKEWCQPLILWEKSYKVILGSLTTGGLWPTALKYENGARLACPSAERVEHKAIGLGTFCSQNTNRLCQLYKWDLFIRGGFRNAWLNTDYGVDH